MKLYRGKNKFFSVSNKNDSYKNRYKRIYKILGVKFVCQNKEKIAFYKQKIQERHFDEYCRRKSELELLKKYREGKKYLLTCYIDTYNQEELIKKAIDSILEQKTQYPYLIKILDDGSTDETFNICLEYAKKYPEKIELNTVCHNSVGKVLTVAYEDIQTKYFCRLDGDDYWCDENKIQDALDFLEKHDDFVTYATDNYMENLYTGKKLSNIHDIERNKNVTNEISYDNFFYVHVSARIHRNVLDFKNEFKNTRKRDRILYYLLLDAGRAYYDDKITSSYTIGPKSAYANKNLKYQRLSQCLILYKINKRLNYRHDKLFSEHTFDKRLFRFKKFFGKKIGWEMYAFWIRYVDIYLYAFKCIKGSIDGVKYNYKNIDRLTGDFQKHEIPIIERVREELV
ncbi:MAG: glycosyltransferase family 2 protein [Candidatus Gastranaerophilales bacterium]|nr:glycosyltransferase family 2 protein [Candidatus Gastranaerophilales bacterium]